MVRASGAERSEEYGHQKSDEHLKHKKEHEWESSLEAYLSVDQVKQMRAFFDGLEKTLNFEVYVCQLHTPDDFYLNEPS